METNCDIKALLRDSVTKDATAPLTIEITPENIVSAKCGDENSCVVALSIYDKFPGVARGVSVGPTYTKIVFDGFVLRYKTPMALIIGLKAFDTSRDPVTGKGIWSLPIGTYTLLVPVRTASLGGRRGEARTKRGPAKAPRPESTANPVPKRLINRASKGRSNRQVFQSYKPGADKKGP